MTAARSSRGSSWVIALAALAAFSANVDLSIVNLALPTIGRAFGMSQSELGWAVNAYVLPYVISILATGRLADRIGARPVLIGGAVLFAGGSLLCSVAPTYAVLLLGRAIQGPGGSAFITMALAVVSGHFVGQDRGRALGLVFAAGSLAAVVGPIVGGALASFVGWPAIFWSQVPLAVVVGALAGWTLGSRPPGDARSFDLPGLGLATLALVAVNVVLLQGNAWGWSSPAIIAVLALAVVSGIGFVVREQRAADPAIHLSVFGSRIFVASVFAGGASWFGIVSGLIQLATYLQLVRGLDPLASAVVIAPWPLVAFLAFPRSGAIVNRVGPERSMLLSVGITMVAALATIAFDRSTPLPVVALVASIGGIPLALGITASTVCALAEFPPEQAGIASGVFNSLRQVGSSLGVAVPAAAFDLGLSLAGGDTASASAWGFASRALVFAIALACAWIALPRRHLDLSRLPQPVP